MGTVLEGGQRARGGLQLSFGDFRRYILQIGQTWPCPVKLAWLGGLVFKLMGASVWGNMHVVWKERARPTTRF